MDTIEQFYGSLMSAFWTPRLWLTHNTTWDDYINKYDDVTGDVIGVRHPHPRDLWAAFPVAVFLLILRYVVEGYVVKPIGELVGLKEMKAKRPEHIPELDRYFRRNRRPTGKETKQLAAELNMDQRRIERWFRIKRNLRKSSGLTKFCEGGWKFLFHLTAFSYGLYVLHDEPFFQDTSLLSDLPSYPHHHVKPEFYSYYVMTLGYWLSLSLSLFTDVRRHDFYILGIHHALTCSLMWLSWSINFVRVGMMVLIIHDSADFLLEITKSMKYAKYDKTSIILFTMFFLAWIYSRLYYYPRYIIYVCWSDYVRYYYESGVHCYSVFTMLVSLSLLLVLHLIWTSTIVHAMYDIVRQGDAVDDRSDSEPEPSSESEESTHNGTANHDNQVNGYRNDKNQNCHHGDHPDKVNHKAELG